jgi:dTDP-4-amino-4,6-dideoxygalactose transaminase
LIKLAQPIIDAAAERAVIDALRSGQLAQGPRVAAFEAAFAEYIGATHAVAVNSGTAALHLALLAHGIGPGDDVIVPAFSFAATANAVLQARATPVFADVRDDDFGIDPASVRAAITPSTRAIMPVHLYGQPCDIDALRGYIGDAAVIEDAAQAVGAKPVGAYGTAAFSFYATKNLTTGEGGMIVTDDANVAERARMLRSQGERTRYVTEELGWNYRMTEVAAALGLAQLPRLDEWNTARAANAARLNAALAGIDGLAPPQELPGRPHVWHQYTVRVHAGRTVRDALRAHLAEQGIESAVFYPAPIHQQPLYARLGYGSLELPVAQRLAGEVLSLPVHPSLTADDIDRITDSVRRFSRRFSAP